MGPFIQYQEFQHVVTKAQDKVNCNVICNCNENQQSFVKIIRQEEQPAEDTNTLTSELQTKQFYGVFKKLKMLVRKLDRQKRYSKLRNQNFEDSIEFQKLLQRVEEFQDELDNNCDNKKLANAMKAQVDCVLRRAYQLMTDNELFIKGVTHVGVQGSNF